MLPPALGHSALVAACTAEQVHGDKSLLVQLSQLPAWVQKYKEMGSGHETKHCPHGWEGMLLKPRAVPSGTWQGPGIRLELIPHGLGHVVTDLRAIEAVRLSEGSSASMSGSPHWVEASAALSALLLSAGFIPCKNLLK